MLLRAEILGLGGSTGPQGAGEQLPDGGEGRSSLPAEREGDGQGSAQDALCKEYEVTSPK